MKRSWKSPVFALLGAAAFSWGVIGLFNRQFASGELYPEFSSMRTDRSGTKLLYDSLEKLPAIAVERNFQPMEFLPRDGATLLLLGVDPIRVNWNADLFLRSVEQIARRGNRVVVAMHRDTGDGRLTQADLDRREESKTKGPKKESTAAEPPLKTIWKVRLKVGSGETEPHPLSIGQADGWRVFDQADAKALAIERDFGKGSVVLMVESTDFTNGSVVAMDRLRQLSAALGASPRVVFDEHHLGIAESGSVVAMARQFRLVGLALGLGICAALFIWRSASAFPPPALSPSAARFSGRTSYAGLLTLLKRHIAPSELVAVGWREWLSTNRRQVTPELREQADAIVGSAAGRPLEAAREIQALLHAKGRH